eukprot:gene25854-biopygen1160
MNSCHEDGERDLVRFRSQTPSEFLWPQKWRTKTAPIELRVEVQHLREAKMLYCNSHLDQSCLGTVL